MSGFLNLMSWLTLIILPVILLLYMQVAFLPYHDVTTTWITRVAVLSIYRVVQAAHVVVGNCTCQSIQGADHFGVPLQDFLPDNRHRLIGRKVMAIIV